MRTNSVQFVVHALQFTEEKGVERAVVSQLAQSRLIKASLNAALSIFLICLLSGFIDRSLLGDDRRRGSLKRMGLRRVERTIALSIKSIELGHIHDLCLSIAHQGIRFTGIIFAWSLIFPNQFPFEKLCQN